MHRITITVNGQVHHCEVSPESLLVSLLREQLGLTGTHVGCDTSQCGCCTVLLEGVSVKACAMLAVQADGCSINTVEGLSKDGVLHPIQEAFSACHGLQCGFCTPGMMMTAACLLSTNPTPSDEEIVHAIEGNLCRCTGYVNIIESVREASRLIASQQA
ncbi:MAG: (2Fe-2S)-binding protein [Burkholderiales bacterium]|jgi:carbon-monoxide dehydrogenase small subunit|nr:(2Fe-2S)-binding protein [Betaproteobacteria bacterium]